MDLPLWDQTDGQDYLILSDESISHAEDGSYRPVENQKGCNTEDNSLCDFSFDYLRDVIEEDAMNQKLCRQVLSRLTKNADEELIKLEEDIMMLQCKLAWDDEEWSIPCSSTLRERIDQLDMLIQSLKKESMEDLHEFYAELEDGKLFPRLHDFVKPLLEEYFVVQNKQVGTDLSITKISTVPATGLIKKKIVAKTSKLAAEAEAKKKCINLPKGSNRKNPTADGQKKNHPKQKSAAEKSVNKHSGKKACGNLTSEGCCRKLAEKTSTTSHLMSAEEREFGMRSKEENIGTKLIANGHNGANTKLSDQDIKKSTEHEENGIAKASLKSGKNSTKQEEDLSENTSIQKAGSEGRDESKASDLELILQVELNPPRFEHESVLTNSDLESPKTEANESDKCVDVNLGSSIHDVKHISEIRSKPQKKRAYTPAFNKDSISRKPSVKIKRQKMNLSEGREAVEALETETNDTDSDLLLDSFRHKKGHAIARKTKKMIDYKLQPQVMQENMAVIQLTDSKSSLKPGDETEKKCKTSSVVLDCMAEELDLEPLHFEKIKQLQKIGVGKNINKHSMIEGPKESTATEIEDGSEVITNTISSPKKKRKASFSSEVMKEKRLHAPMKFSVVDSSTSRSTTEESTDSLSADGTLQNSLLYIGDAGRLSLIDLRAIAKSRGVPRYSKLNKQQLREALVLKPLDS